MKTKLIIVLVAAAVMVSLGASRIVKTQEKAEMQASVSSSTAPIGGLGAEDR